MWSSRGLPSRSVGLDDTITSSPPPAFYCLSVAHDICIFAAVVAEITIERVVHLGEEEERDKKGDKDEWTELFQLSLLKSIKAAL